MKNLFSECWFNSKSQQISLLMVTLYFLNFTLAFWQLTLISFHFMKYHYFYKVTLSYVFHF